MQKLTGYMAGINLGGWISQYGPEESYERFDTFIVEEDIRLIASWGMDHIRVPVDYPVLMDKNNLGVFLEDGFAYLDKSVEWAKKYGLNVMIDVHRAPGFSFNTPEKNSLFSDPVMQGHFVDLWKAIAARYVGEGDNVMYELLNEIVEPDSTRWNTLAQKLIDAIREVDTKHFIVVGGIRYNSVTALKDLPIFDDPRMVYNFHMYEPGLFTHQHAGWNKEVFDFNRDLAYPSDDISAYKEFAALSHTNKEATAFDAYTKMDAQYLREFMQPAVDFINEHDKLMYCGEYGAIDYADIQSRINYTNDVADFLIEHGIGRAAWSYKGMNFTHIDENRKAVDGELIKAASKK